MATRNSKRYVRRHVSPRGISYTTTARVAGFESRSKTFPTKAAAIEWAETTEETLRKQKEHVAEPRAT